MAEIAYTANGEIVIPDIQIMKMLSGWKTEALCGYGYIVAVMDQNGKCLGWAINPKPAP